MKPLLRALGLALAIAASCPTHAGLVSNASGQIDLLNFGPGYNNNGRLATYDITATTVRDSINVFFSNSPLDTVGYAATASTSANGSGVHVDSYARLFDTSPTFLGSFFGVRASAGGRITVDDMIISGPAGFVLTSYQLHISGSLGGTSVPGASLHGGTPHNGGGSAVSIYTFAQGAIVGEGYFNAGSINQNLYHVGSGLLTNFDGDDELTSNLFSVATNMPFTVALDMSVVSTAFNSDGGSGFSTAFADFGHTLSFATDRPVFNLPDGYTVNSVSAGIVNNHFSAPAGVPEPGSLAMVGLGLVGVLSSLRRRGRVAVSGRALRR